MNEVVKQYKVIKQYDAISFHNYIYSLIEYYNYPKVDIIITSPPYNIGIPYTGYIDNKPDSEWMDMIIHSLYPTDKICSDGALMYLNMKINSSKPLQSLSEIVFIGEQIEEMSNWKFIQDICWVMPNKQHLDPFKVISKFSSYKEMILLFGKGNVKIRKDLIGENLSEEYLNDKRYKKVIDKYKEKFGRAFKDIGDVWVIPILKYNQYIKKYNPAEFPPMLVECALKSHPKFGNGLTVYDSFVGGGTTAFVAKNLGCNYYVCDISEAMISTTNRRLKKKYIEHYISYQ